VAVLFGFQVFKPWAALWNPMNMEKLLRWDIVPNPSNGGSAFATPITMHYGECADSCAGKPLYYSEMTLDQKRKFKAALYAIEEFNRAMGLKL
jgi:hypothetical protein